MMFLNGILAFGVLAFAVPLIIHILNRSRFRTVEWGAMHLLESVIRVNHKRFRMDQLILLLVRCAIPILLALCLARPVLTGAKLLEGNSPVSLVILLDTSYSMETADVSGSRFQSAIEAACAIVNAAGRGSEIAVIQTGGRPTPLFDQPVFDPQAVVRKLRRTRAGYGASDIPGALDEAIAQLSGMSHARRELIVISDFQPADWQAISANPDEAIRRALDAMQIRPEVTLLPVGRSVTENVSVEALEYPRRALGVGQQFSVRAAIRNHGTTEIPSARVTLKIDGTQVAVSQVTLPAKGTTQTLFPCVFEQPGSHVVEVTVVTDDPLPDDNRFAAAINIWDSINVLLVDGDSNSQPLQSETDYLSIALTPFTFGGTRLADLVQTQTIQPGDLNEERLKQTRVAVLANVARLETTQVAALSGFVQDGGALLVSTGNRVDLQWYRDQLFAGGTGLLPAAFGPLQGQMETGDQKSGQSSRILSQRFDHPAVEFFNEPANGDLSTAEIRRWHQLDGLSDGTMKPPQSSPQTPPLEELNKSSLVATLLRLDNGAPLIVERRMGDGVVVQMATACDADWSDLPMRPFYVPLMQQLVTTMASGVSPPRNISTGDAAVIALSGDDAPQALSVVTPDGTRRTVGTVPKGRLQLARFEETQRPGIYTVSATTSGTIHFVAETSRSESDLSVLPETGLISLSEAMSSSLIRSPAEYLEQDRLRRHGQEIWKLVLIAFLGFLILELILQQRFARVRV